MKKNSLLLVLVATMFSCSLLGTEEVKPKEQIWKRYKREIVKNKIHSIDELNGDFYLVISNKILLFIGYENLNTYLTTGNSESDAYFPENLKLDGKIINTDINDGSKHYQLILTNNEIQYKHTVGGSFESAEFYYIDYFKIYK